MVCVESNVILVEGLQKEEAVVVALLPPHIEVFVVAALTQCLNQKFTHQVFAEFVMGSKVDESYRHLGSRFDLLAAVEILSFLKIICEVSLHSVVTEVRLSS